MRSTKHLKELFELLSIPSVSAQSKHKKDIKKASVWLKKKLVSLGFKADILPTDGHPVVFAENLTAGKNKPTLLIYGHYDVQDPEPLDEWTSDPFKPEVRSGNIYARGATDDKGQLFTWLAAIDEIVSKKGKLPVNIKFLIEGEEEVGSKNLDEFVNQNKSLLVADICVISDTRSLSENQPLITYGLRGITYFEIIIKTLEKDVHSGTYGGNVLNPANVLAQIISKLKNEKHRVLIPDFYKNVRKLSKKEQKELKSFPFTEKEVKEETGAKVAVGVTNMSVQARVGAYPTLDVNGIWSGYQDEGIKTIIPAMAGAKISMRLVPNQTSDEIAKKFEKYVKSITPKGVEIEIKRLADGEPIIMERDSKFFKAAEKSYKKVFGKKPLYNLEGGSIPVTATFMSILGIDSLLMGYGLPDDGAHGPNEKLSISMFEKGIRTNIEFLKSL
jgi:acetylornithine deacetylase/succinyl-diaminopimelate desuccinylase-like protein